MLPAGCVGYCRRFPAAAVDRPATLPAVHPAPLAAADNTCSVTVEWRVARVSADAYSASLHGAVMSDAAGTQESRVLCAVNRQAPALGCQLNITRPAWARFMHLPRSVWTQARPIQQALARTSAACLASPDRSHSQVPFHAEVDG